MTERDPLPQFYECPVCGQMHSVNRNPGIDCRDDATRFICDDLDRTYGEHGWREVEDPFTDEPVPPLSFQRGA